jgi:HPt (histidine-containing phosphotransfer) domain-containing protein
MIMPIPTIDTGVIDELRELADDDEPSFFFDQVRLFSERGRTLVEELNSAVAVDDPERARAAAHSLGGSSAIVGAAKLQTLCMDLEEQCDRWRRANARMMTDLIAEEFDAAERHLLGEVSTVYIEVRRPAVYPWLKSRMKLTTM